MQACANAAKIWMQVSLNCFTELIIKKEKLLQLLLLIVLGLLLFFCLKLVLTYQCMIYHLVSGSGTKER